jgi:hypothetical protein
LDEIARPAASSLAELMRTPVDSLSIVWLMVRSFLVIAFAAIFADIFVLIVAILVLLEFIAPKSTLCRRFKN